MSIAFRSLGEVDPAQVRELLVRKSWNRDWSEERAERYIAWRYGERADGDTLVACAKGQCVGILDSFIRSYWIGDRQEVVRETCDWFCLPEYRALGVGLHLMRRMMAKPEPILVIGGTDVTQNLLPRLKWTPLPDVGNFILGVSARTIAGLFAHSRWPGGIGLARLVPPIPLVRRLPAIAPPSANSQVLVRGLGEVAPLFKTGTCTLAPTLDAKGLDWLARAPDVLGQFLVLSFVCDGEPVGTSISRLQDLPSFGVTAQIVHVQAVRPDIVDWMAGATVRELIGRGAGAVLCRTSCPATTAALSALGFWRRKPTPAYWWHADKPAPTGALHLSTLQADDALQFR